MQLDKSDGLLVKNAAGLYRIYFVNALYKSTSRGPSPKECPAERVTSALAFDAQ